MEIDLNGYMELAITWGMRVLSALLILIAGWVIGSWTRSRIQKIDKLDKTISSFLGGFAKYAILAVSFVAVLGQFGVETGPTRRRGRIGGAGTISDFTVDLSVAQGRFRGG